ncbi:MAG TPA: dockerin type I domain-containing protein, partial [Caldilineaceae bacterium]|nr:dockerin type I domain-containing protein [Caldilineaceae bacterium]
LTNSSAYCDVNRDGSSDSADLALVEAAVGTDNTQPTFNYRTDLDRTGRVTSDDVALTQACTTAGGSAKVYLPMITR